ncbi:MAG: sterol desaturase [Bacteroidetes bacterium B1(2017)]|nr:MAG: sterol desaturase [Bacteroidetes bacterium B1(2017)]
MQTLEASIYSWQIDAAAIFIRYFVMAGLAYFVFYVWKKEAFAARKLSASPIPKGQIIKELAYSCSTLTIFCLLSWFIFKLYYLGYTRIYAGLNQHSWLYFFGSIVGMVLLHDVYFYWTHRLIHWKRLYKWVHQVHHQSVLPNPFSAFSFHPFEAILAAGIVPLIVFSFPVHPYALFIFLGYMTFINVMGHLGYEIFSQKFRRSILGKYQNTGTHHSMHHQNAKVNFGLYFTFWDKWMKTEKIKEGKN